MGIGKGQKTGYPLSLKKAIDIRKKACIIPSTIREYLMEDPDILRWKIQRLSFS